METVFFRSDRAHGCTGASAARQFFAADASRYDAQLRFTSDTPAARVLRMRAFPEPDAPPLVAALMAAEQPSQVVARAVRQQAAAPGDASRPEAAVVMVAGPSKVAAQCARQPVAALAAQRREAAVVVMAAEPSKAVAQRARQRAAAAARPRKAEARYVRQQAAAPMVAFPQSAELTVRVPQPAEREAKSALQREVALMAGSSSLQAMLPACRQAATSPRCLTDASLAAP
jgi:hypothetical protein